MKTMNKKRSTNQSRKPPKTLSWVLADLSDEERKAVKAALCKIGEEILSGVFPRPDDTPPA